MNVAVVYYSLEGNTDFVAKKIAGEFDADIIRLIPSKEYPTGKVSKYIWGGKSVTFKEQPSLEPYQFDVEKYDLILFGTPIWASSYAPPLRTFFAENVISSKRIGVFTCCAGGSAEKCYRQIKHELPDCEIVATLKLVNPLKQKNSENNKKINEFCNNLKTNLPK